MNKDIRMKLGRNLTSSIRQTSGNGQDKIAELFDNACASMSKTDKKLRTIDFKINIFSKEEQYYTIIDRGEGMDIFDIEKKLLTYGTNKKTNTGLNSYGTGAKNASGLGEFEYITRKIGDDQFIIPSLFGKEKGIDIPVKSTNGDKRTKMGYPTPMVGTAVTISKKASDGFEGLDVFTFFKNESPQEYIKRVRLFIALRYASFLAKGFKFRIFVKIKDKESVRYTVSKKDIYKIALSDKMTFKDGRNENAFTIIGKENDFVIKVKASFTPTSESLKVLTSALSKDDKDFYFGGKYNPYKKNQVNLVIKQYNKVINATDVSHVITTGKNPEELKFRTKHNSLNELFLEIDIIEGIQSTTTKNGFNRTNKAIKEFIVLLNKKLQRIEALKYADQVEAAEQKAIKDAVVESMTLEHDSLRDQYVKDNFSKSDFSISEFKVAGVCLDAYSENDGIATILEVKSRTMRDSSQFMEQLGCYLGCVLDKDLQKDIQSKSKEYSQVTFPKEVIYQIFAKDTDFSDNDIAKRKAIKKIYKECGLNLIIQTEYN